MEQVQVVTNVIVLNVFVSTNFIDNSYAIKKLKTSVLYVVDQVSCNLKIDKVDSMVRLIRYRKGCIKCMQNHCI